MPFSNPEVEFRDGTDGIIGYQKRRKRMKCVLYVLFGSQMAIHIPLSMAIDPFLLKLIGDVNWHCTGVKQIPISTGWCPHLRQLFWNDSRVEAKE